LAVRNKCDLCPPGTQLVPSSENSDAPPHVPTLHVSALTGEGIEALRTALVALADQQKPELFAEEQLAINARHAEALRRAELSLRTALEGLDPAKRLPIELVAGELRAALDALGEIAGRIDHERMLDALFATFCIGK
jgi:tRNA modification GTPase